MKKDIKLIIFDWSGTISDDRRPVYETHVSILRQHNKPMLSFKQWSECIVFSAQEFLYSQGISGTDKELFNLYEKNLKETIESGLIPKIYPEANLKKEAFDYGLISFFDFILGSSMNKAEDLAGICRQFNFRPEEVLYVGDTTKDIKIAKEKGVCSAGICHGYHSKELLKNENPDLLLDCLSDLKNYLS